MLHLVPYCIRAQVKAQVILGFLHRGRTAEVHAASEAVIPHIKPVTAGRRSFYILPGRRITSIPYARQSRTPAHSVARQPPGLRLS